MPASQSASVGGKPILCPVCGGDRFVSKQIMVTDKWLQALDMEEFGQEGIMLICARCTHIEQFGKKGAVVLSS